MARATYVLGRLDDIRIYDNNPAFARLDLPDWAWNYPINDRFVELMIRGRNPVFLVGRPGARWVETLFSFQPESAQLASVTGREVSQFLGAGYTIVASGRYAILMP